MDAQETRFGMIGIRNNTLGVKFLEQSHVSYDQVLA